MALRLCGTCCRHVRQHERVCPFCGAALSAASGPSRALTAAAMIGLGLAFGACGGAGDLYGSVPYDAATGGSGMDGGSGATPVPLYAAVVPDSGNGAAAAQDSGASAGGGGAGADGGSGVEIGGWGYIYASAPF
jgi:hypothetical protein